MAKATWKVEGNTTCNSSTCINNDGFCQDDLMKQEQSSNSIFRSEITIEISNNNGRVILSVTDKAGQSIFSKAKKQPLSL